MLGQMTLFAPDQSLPLRRRVSLAKIDTADARYMLEQFHYLHRTRVGRQINYAVVIDGIIDGVITYAYPLLAHPILNIPSDEILEFARLYLHSNIPHTATCAVGKSLKRVQSDWMTSFPDAKKPLLVVSWSDAERHAGTIYKAANFTWLRRTTGGPWGKQQKVPGNSKRGDRERHSDYRHIKDCWVYRLKNG